jgi:hypothetical protein
MVFACPVLRRSLIAGVLAAFLVAGGSQAAVSQTLYAYFDVDGGLQFRYADSSNVGTTIPPGTYTINLNNNGADDLGNDHIFHLAGPGVDYKAANVDTQAVFSVTFQSGATYRVFDDLNPKISETIVATTAAAPPAQSVLPPSPITGSTKPTTSGNVGSEAPLPFRGALDAIVYGGGKVSLMRNAKKVTSLKNGRYTFAVDDESKTAGFTVRSLRGKPITITSNAFVGSHDATLTLRPGRWFFFTTGGRQSSFAVVS